MAADFPRSYKDPTYDEVDTRTTEKLGLPAGLLAAIRTRGERSNHDQVSSANATSVYQFIPATKKAILDKYGIDVTLSPENASEGAGLLLKEGLQRNKGDAALAVAEYTGGLDRRQWGPVTRSYVKRVVGREAPTDTPTTPQPSSQAAPAGGSTFQRALAANPAPTGVGGPQIAQVFQAYQSGQMTPEEAKEFEADVNSGAVLLPRGAQLKTAPGSAGSQPAPAPAQPLPDGVAAAYFSGQMSPEDKAQLDADVAAGLVQAPQRVEIPAAVAPGTQTPAATVPMVPDTPTSLADKMVGAGETALQVATGATGGTLGAIGGTVGATAGAILSGQFGTKDAADAVERAAAEGGQALTYAPRTVSGQQQSQAVGEVMQQAIPVTGLTGEMQAMAAGVRPIAQAPRAAATAAVRNAVEAVPAPVANAARAGVGAAKAGASSVTAAADAILSKAGFGERAKKPTLGTGGSAGAAGTDVATMRRATAQDLPVPIDLTEGQATRDFEQLRFEGETAKDAKLGAPLRERSAEQNSRLKQNYEALIDDVGAKTPNNTEAARVLVDETLRPAAAKLKAEYRAKYQAADKAGETAESVSLQPLADYLNENRAGRTSAPILNTIAEELKVKGVGDGSLAEGSVVGLDATLKQTEEIRKAVNRFVKDADPNDVRMAVEIKGIIDGITEGKGGQLYKEARQARQRHAQLFDDNAAVARLTKTKRGTADRQVALEDVFRKSVLNGSREDLSMLRRTLDVSDQKAGHKPGVDGPGAQAWREMQGATLRHIMDESVKSVGTDVAGNHIVSAAQMKSTVRALDKGEKLDFVLGKKRAQTVRDIVEIAEHVKTMPPGTVNTSNTASVLLAALAEAGTTGALTGLPVPAISVIKALTSEIKDRKLAARVRESLGETQKTTEKF